MFCGITCLVVLDGLLLLFFLVYAFLLFVRTNERTEPLRKSHEGILNVDVPVPQETNRLRWIIWRDGVLSVHKVNDLTISRAFPILSQISAWVRPSAVIMAADSLSLRSTAIFVLTALLRTLTKAGSTHTDNRLHGTTEIPLIQRRRLFFVGLTPTSRASASPSSSDASSKAVFDEPFAIGVSFFFVAGREVYGASQKPSWTQAGSPTPVLSKNQVGRLE